MRTLLVLSVMMVSGCAAPVPSTELLGSSSPSQRGTTGGKDAGESAVQPHAAHRRGGGGRDDHHAGPFRGRQLAGPRHDDEPRGLRRRRLLQLPRHAIRHRRDADPRRAGSNHVEPHPEHDDGDDALLQRRAARRPGKRLRVRRVAEHPRDAPRGLARRGTRRIFLSRTSRSPPPSSTPRTSARASCSSARAAPPPPSTGRSRRRCSSRSTEPASRSGRDETTGSVALCATSEQATET